VVYSTAMRPPLPPPPLFPPVQLWYPPFAFMFPEPVIVFAVMYMLPPAPPPPAQLLALLPFAVIAPLIVIVLVMFSAIAPPPGAPFVVQPPPDPMSVGFVIEP